MTVPRIFRMEVDGDDIQTLRVHNAGHADILDDTYSELVERYGWFRTAGQPTVPYEQWSGKDAVKTTKATAHFRRTYRIILSDAAIDFFAVPPLPPSDAVAKYLPIDA